MLRRLKLLSRAITTHVWRTAIFLVGAAVLLIGVALLPLPGPGTLVVALGLAILSVEFVWARQGLDKLKAAAHRVQARARRRLAPNRAPVASPSAPRPKQSVRVRRSARP